MTGGLCGCGCGRAMTGYEPSLWFKDVNCFALFQASALYPNPEAWRAQQRLWFVLYYLVEGWGDVMGSWQPLPWENIERAAAMITWEKQSRELMPEDFRVPKGTEIDVMVEYYWNRWGGHLDRRERQSTIRGCGLAEVPLPEAVTV